MRHFTFIDQCLTQVNHALDTIFTTASHSRDNPADNIAEKTLSPDEKKNSIGCMRVNHTGEVCAQALYRGQLSVCRSDKTKKMLEHACIEETDHLVWTKNRLAELNGHTSYFNPFWYANSFFIGAVAGLAGDQWSLGFVEETEIQVAKHLESHLHRLSQKDEKSRAIVEKMRDEEIQHEQSAHAAGAKELPFLIKKLMRLQSKVMTIMAFHW